MLTEAEREAMAHCVGHHSSKSCSVHGGRNHYVAPADDPLWSGLVDRGLAERRTPSVLPDGEVSFSLTREGREALESDHRSQRPPVTGRSFVVKFSGYPDCPIQVRADSHAKARYAAVQRVADAFNFTAREGFTRIESCRLGC